MLSLCVYFLIHVLTCVLAFQARPITISPVTKGKNFTIHWHREPDDPLQFNVVLHPPGNPDTPLQVVVVQVHPDQPAQPQFDSIAQIPCNDEGPFEIDVLSIPDNRHLAGPFSFIVQLNGQKSEFAGIPSTASTASPTTTVTNDSSMVVPSPSPSIADSVEAKPKGGQLALIIGAAIGSLVVLGAIVFGILFFVRQRSLAARRRRQTRFTNGFRRSSANLGLDTISSPNTLVASRSTYRSHKKGDPWEPFSDGSSVKSQKSDRSGGLTQALAASYAGLYNSIYGQPSSPRSQNFPDRSDIESKRTSVSAHSHLSAASSRDSTIEFSTITH